MVQEEIKKTQRNGKREQMIGKVIEEYEKQEKEEEISDENTTNGEKYKRKQR